MGELVKCWKCKGTGKYLFNNGMTGHCYACNGKGTVKRIPHKEWTALIIIEDGKEPQPFFNLAARSENEAIKKAKATFMRGVYKDRVDTVSVKPNGIKYTYKTH